MLGRFKPQCCDKGSSLEHTLIEIVLYDIERGVKSRRKVEMLQDVLQKLALF